MWGTPELDGALLAQEDLEAVQSAELEVRNVTYMVPSEARQQMSPRIVLSRVTCRFPPGRLSAIMGASGSGKTSLLTLLRGLSSPGCSVVGEVLCNGTLVDVKWMRGVCGAVPQEDVYLSALTPREMLSFAAELRLPRSWTAKDRAMRVDRMIWLLRIEQCADSAIGDEKSGGLRGISGGERRRLSVGLAIVGGLPQCLLCDEPTSGLDSASATNIVTLLRGLSERGVTVLCAIHQPSFEVFSEFGHLLLLQAGETVYCGKVEGVEAYFSKNGTPTPQHTNPAHHYIWVVQNRGEHWALCWRRESPSSPRSQAQAVASGARPRIRSVSGGRGSSVWRQTSILLRRTLLENFKNRKKFLRGVIMRLPASTLIGLFFCGIGAVPTQHSIWPLKGVLFLASQNPLIETFYAGALTFQATKGLLKREYYDGLYSAHAYYLAYYIGFVAMQIPWTFAWVVPMYILVGLPLEFAKCSLFLLVSFLIVFMSCTCGSYVGARTRDQEGNRAVLAPLLIPMILFSGYVIPYAQLSPIWRPLYYISPVQWSMSILERNHYRGVIFVDCDVVSQGLSLQGGSSQSLRDCYATGEEYLRETSNPLSEWLGISGMLVIYLCYITLFLFLNISVLRKHVLDGRV